jgi:hypothetical protein
LLEHTILFSVFSLFLLALYLSLRKSHEERQRDAEEILRNPIPGVDKIFKTLTLVFALVSLLVAFYSSMLGEPSQVTVTNNTLTNFTSNVTVMNGVSAGNTTFQTFPAINGTVKTVNVVYSTGQFNFLVTLYGVIQWMLYFVGAIYVIIWVVRYFGLLKRIIRPPKEKQYG